MWSILKYRNLAELLLPKCAEKHLQKSENISETIWYNFKNAKLSWFQGLHIQTWEWLHQQPTPYGIQTAG